MKPTLHNTVATAGGGAIGVLMLQSVDWNQVYGGETTKLLVSLLIILAGYLMYRGRPPEEPPAQEPPPDSKP